MTALFYKQSIGNTGFPINLRLPSRQIDAIQSLQFALIDEWLKPLLQVFLSQLLSLPLLLRPTKVFRWDKDIAYNVDNTICSYTVLDRHRRKPIDLDADDAAVAGDIDTKRAVFKQSRQIDLEQILI